MAEAAASSADVTQPKSPAISFINLNKGKPLLITDEYVFKLNKIITTKPKQAKTITLQSCIDNLGERYYDGAINAME
ncbi:unnamed protein product [Rotaria sordida]|uniref:Uncharacterized protein n=1 Tax=Rotaria sordida TaxID=392033 RepID=A0A816E242_9BILA|nr:unnamed protein product [Rotaria sordida]CAF1642039.1 unnamed protein product [Rotaria sordida]